MKHFVIEIKYIKPLEEIEKILPFHREYLQTGYKSGMLLCSGPQTPRTGGLIIARANEIEEINNFVSQDPYNVNKAADYRIIEFTPVLHQELLRDWIG